MVDPQTLAAYDAAAHAFSQEWEGQPPPTDLYELLLRHFQAGPTADIGCGSGRDVAWLVANGFDACGFDASESLLEEARRFHPGPKFALASLPELDNLENDFYQNVLCETVIMHLEPVVIPLAMRRLLEILRPHGVLYLSWRVTEQTSQRDAKGRLYSAFDPMRVLGELGERDVILFDHEEVSASSGKKVRRLIVRKAGPGVVEGA